VDLPYEEQLSWGITRLRPEQLQLCIRESHSDELILAGSPYPGAVETVREWHRQGHYIHVTSHRDRDRHEATAAWLQLIGLPFDDLHCSYDKVSRCVELDIDLLIDDCPLNLASAIEHGILVATIEHPWNRDLCEEEDVLGAADWAGLGSLLEPVLADQTRSLVQ
jgi:uncharacterized HAD superfamily protein